MRYSSECALLCSDIEASASAYPNGLWKHDSWLEMLSHPAEDPMADIVKVEFERLVGREDGYGSKGTLSVARWCC